MAGDTLLGIGMVRNARAGLKHSAAKDKDLTFEKETPPSPQLYVFFSFDLVNSTVYKNKQMGKWPSVFAQFYQVIKEEMKQRFPGIKVLKYIGDEIIFFKEIITSGDLFEVIPGASKVLTSTLVHLDNLYNEDFKPLSLKGTIWCAPITVCEGEEWTNRDMTEFRNIALDVVYENEVSLRDFIGPDIDIGFRISKYAGKEKLVISADFAYLLLQCSHALCVKDKRDSLVQNLKIVSFEDLKGIWADRYYPIIWYYDDWKKIKGTFEYDEPFKNKIINNVYLDQVDDLKELAKIYDQLGITGDKVELLNILKESEVHAREREEELLKRKKQVRVILDGEE